jgi:hypothetical protein
MRIKFTCYRKLFSFGEMFLSWDSDSSLSVSYDTGPGEFELWCGPLHFVCNISPKEGVNHVQPTDEGDPAC